MTDAETDSVALSGAVAGLCPLTEANLGDGAFNGPRFIEAGGRFGIGTDSNVNISVTGELSIFEYSQRLRDRTRNALAKRNESTGHNLYTSAAKGGAQALGRSSGAITKGNCADLVAIDSQHIQLAGLKTDQLLDGWLFATSRNVVTDVWSAGRHNVQESRHVQHDQIEAVYRKTMLRLSSLI